MRRLIDAELDQSEDTELCIQHLPILQAYALILLEKAVEILDKGRIELDERRIESLVEILEFGLILIPWQSLLELVKIT